MGGGAQSSQRAAEPQPQRAYVALLKMPDVDMHWTVSLNPEANQVQVRAGGTPPAQVADSLPRAARRVP